MASGSPGKKQMSESTSLPSRKGQSDLTATQTVTEPHGNLIYPKDSEGGPSCDLEGMEDIPSGPLPSTSGVVGEDQQDLDLDHTVTQTVTEPRDDPIYPKASEGGPSCDLDSKPSMEDIPSGPLPSTSGAVGEDQQDLVLDHTVTQIVTEPHDDPIYPKASEGGPSCDLDSKPSMEDIPSKPLPSTSGAVGEDQQDLELAQKDVNGTQCTSMAPLRFHSRCGRNSEVNYGGEVLERKRGWFGRYSAGLTDRPLEISERFEIEVTKNDHKQWLSLGLTSHSPEVIEYPQHMDGLKNGVWMMRCYSSGHNVQVNGKVVKKVVETTPILKVGDRLSLIVEPDQSLVFYLNQDILEVSMADIPHGHGLYGFVDLWAKCTSVKIIPHPIQPQSLPFWAVQRDEIELTEEKVGVGGWASVKVANFRGVRVAAKCLHDQIICAHNIRLFTREMNMAAQARHPNLLQFIGATMDDEEPIILTELMPTSLRRILEEGTELTRKQITPIVCDVAKALNYLHLSKPEPIVHRDVSSANVLLEPCGPGLWKAKLSDYGSVNFVRYTTTAGPGNPLYAAPEANDPNGHSPKMDVYSFGMLLVEVCSRELPANHEKLIRKIQWPKVVTIIGQCICRDPQARPNMADIVAKLSRLTV